MKGGERGERCAWHDEGKAKRLIPRLTVYLQDVTTKNLVRHFDLSRSKAMKRPFEKSFEINDTENTSSKSLRTLAFDHHRYRTASLSSMHIVTKTMPTYVFLLVCFDSV